MLQLKSPWRDGTTHIVLSPLEFMQRLAVLVPRPRRHLIRFHGVLAPHARLRAAVVPGRVEKATEPAEAHRQRPARMSWARLLKSRLRPPHRALSGRLIYSTTNGTVAINACAGAAQIYCGALLNGRALAARLATAHPDQTLLLVCAGSMNNFNLEDFYGAGYLVDLLAGRLGERADFSDAARAARALFLHGDPEASLLGCRVGKMMAGRGLEREVRFAAQLSAFDVIPRLQDGELLPV